MPQPTRLTVLVPALLAGLAAILPGTGCASAARYDVVAPASARGEIPLNAGPIVQRDKIDYEIFQAEEKIVVRFVNRTGGVIRLLEQSVAHDARGRGFDVEVQDIAPDQAGRVILPPAFAEERGRPTPVPTEVQVGGIDEGGLIGTRRDREFNDATGGSTAGAAAPAAGFRWPANGLARLRLVYRLSEGDTNVTHEWSIRRTR